MHAAASASASRRVGRIHLLQSPHLLPRRIVIPSCCSCHVPLISTCLVPARSVSTATLSSTRTTTTTTTTPFTSNINIDNNNNYNNNNYNNNNNNSNHVHRRDDGPSIGSSSSSSSVNPEEIAKFNELSKHWWDPDGEIGPLMHMNPIRMSFIRQHVVQHFQRYTSLQKPFDELNMLDVGCGGGLLSESLARLGAHVTGIDASSGGIAAAKQHAQLDPQLTQRINYECTSAESLLASGRQFDVVCALEIVEHVNDPRTFIQTVANLVKPGGMLFVSTINKNAKSYALAILGAEYIFGWVARGTHNWNQFITPDTLHQYITEATAIPSNNATHPNHTNHTTHHHNNNHHHHNHHHHHHHHATMNGNGGHHHGHVVGTTFPSVSAGLGIGASPSIAPTQPHTPVIHPEAVVTSARPPSLFFTIVSTKGLIYSPLHREFQLHDIDIDVNYIVAAKRPH